MFGVPTLQIEIKHLMFNALFTLCRLIDTNRRGSAVSHTEGWVLES